MVGPCPRGGPLSSSIPLLPLVLDATPPGLALALAQEGIPYRIVSADEPDSSRAGRFVLFDGRSESRQRIEARLCAGQVGIDIDVLRQDQSTDPFRALVDLKSTRMAWTVNDKSLVERVSRRDKGSIRRRLMSKLRLLVQTQGGLWARLSPYPHPYRSAFNLRVDLDERNPTDYALFASARKPIEDCTTHFVSTAAYGQLPAVLADLKGLDTQSHGHHHVVSSDQDFNRINLRRAHEILTNAEIRVSGYTAPHGRWNRGLDGVLDELGYNYSSDFGLGYDDLPFFPWLGERFSSVLQVPVHPICEGLFLDAGISNAEDIAYHFESMVRAKIHAREPAFVYGHPERRLARMPEVLRALSRSILNESLVWRTTMTAFAEWWRWRSTRRWSVDDLGEGQFQARFEDWDPRYPLAIEIAAGDHVASVPVRRSRLQFDRESLVFERWETEAAAPPPRRVPRAGDWKSRLRESLDWETVTPCAELPTSTIQARVKKGLRRWSDATRGGSRP